MDNMDKICDYMRYLRDTYNNMCFKTNSISEDDKIKYKAKIELIEYLLQEIHFIKMENKNV